MTSDLSRRKWLKVIGLTLVSAPMVGVSQNAAADVNIAARANYQYRDYPNGIWSCSICAEYLPASNPLRGECRLIQMDDNIHEDGYCIGWKSERPVQSQ